MTKKYRVLFHGLKGDKEAFKARMVHFRAPAETVDRMISAAPIILKGDLTLGDARRYADAVQDERESLCCLSTPVFTRFKNIG